MSKVKIINISIFTFVLVALVGIAVAWDLYTKTENPENKPLHVSNFTECVAVGNPVMESYPRQCRHKDMLFVENIGNELEKVDFIQVETPRPNQAINNLVTIRGIARGYWFFEATFPVVLLDTHGTTLAEGYATAQDEWMTEDFVPFKALLSFDMPAENTEIQALLVLHKANASGLPEHDDRLEIPVIVK